LCRFFEKRNTSKEAEISALKTSLERLSFEKEIMDANNKKIQEGHVTPCVSSMRTTEVEGQLELAELNKRIHLLQASEATLMRKLDQMMLDAVTINPLVPSVPEAILAETCARKARGRPLLSYVKELGVMLKTLTDLMESFVGGGDNKGTKVTAEGRRVLKSTSKSKATMSLPTGAPGSYIGRFVWKQFVPEGSSQTAKLEWFRGRIAKVISVLNTTIEYCIHYEILDIDDIHNVAI
jgi:hypothetical protein